MVNVLIPILIVLGLIVVAAELGLFGWLFGTDAAPTTPTPTTTSMRPTPLTSTSTSTASPTMLLSTLTALMSTSTKTPSSSSTSSPTTSSTTSTRSTSSTSSKLPTASTTQLSTSTHDTTSTTESNQNVTGRPVGEIEGIAEVQAKFQAETRKFILIKRQMSITTTIDTYKDFSGQGRDRRMIKEERDEYIQIYDEEESQGLVDELEAFMMGRDNTTINNSTMENSNSTKRNSSETSTEFLYDHDNSTSNTTTDKHNLLFQAESEGQIQYETVGERYIIVERKTDISRVVDVTPDRSGGEKEVITEQREESVKIYDREQTEGKIDQLDAFRIMDIKTDLSQ